MRHTAGFAYGPGNTPAHDAYVKADPMALDIDLAEMGKRLSKVPLLFDPGARWSYSIAVDVQALLVQVLSGQKFAGYVRQNVFEPLGMRETAWRQPDERLPRLAALYRKSEGKIVRDSDGNTRKLNFQDNRLTGGGFGLASTVDDYMRLARMLLNSGELDGARILKPSTVKLMATDHLDPADHRSRVSAGQGFRRVWFRFRSASFPAAKAARKPRSRGRVLLGRSGVDALLGGSIQPPGGGLLHAKDALRRHTAPRHPGGDLRAGVFGTRRRLSLLPAQQ
jgi:CubicO group peptidase (beta-lactamase class C family)